jgi:hypothetical protein
MPTLATKIAQEIKACYGSTTAPKPKLWRVDTFKTGRKLQLRTPVRADYPTFASMVLTLDRTYLASDLEAALNELFPDSVDESKLASDVASSRIVPREVLESAVERVCAL